MFRDWIDRGLKKALMQQTDRDILTGIAKELEDDRPVTADDFDLDPSHYEVTNAGEDGEGLFVVVRKPDGTTLKGVDQHRTITQQKHLGPGVFVHNHTQPVATAAAPPSPVKATKASQDQFPPAEPAESHTEPDLLGHCTTDHERKVLERVLKRIDDEKKRAAIMERARKVRDGDVHTKPDEPEDWWDRNRIAYHVDPALYGITINTPDSFVKITNTNGA